MAASIGADQAQGNGPYVPMYKMKPHQCIEIVDLPDVMYKMKSYYANPMQASGNSPLAILENRQMDVLKRLDQLRETISKLKQKYNVTTTSTSLSSSSSAPVNTAPMSCLSQPSQQTNLAASMTDLVISVDPASIPLSLIVLCEQLSQQYRVLKSTFVHSSVSGQVPDQLGSLLNSNGSIKRSDCQLAITLIWKKVEDGPHLVIDPTRQTPIRGEANVARYLTRLLNPSHDESDIVRATQIDDLLDLAQLKVVQGSQKEKAAAVRALNSTLGKQQWLVGNGPSVADIVCWSVLYQAGQAASPPANVKQWLGRCNEHRTFQTALGLVEC